MVVLPAWSGAVEKEPGHRLVVVVGAGGESEYGESFAAMEKQWRETAERAGATYHSIGVGESPGGRNDREALEGYLGEVAGRNGETLWLVLLGHGTFDGVEAKYNLRGPDLTAGDLTAWLEPKKGNLIVINTTSSSAPFLPLLAGPGRIIITATKSAHEIFYTRFGEYFVAALAAPAADIDRDGQTSLLESFLTAARQVEEEYAEKGLLATEHAILDDNGDGRGTRADWFRGVRAEKKAGGGLPDGLRAHQVHLDPSKEERLFPPDLRRRRDAFELEVVELRYRREELGEEAYYEALENIFREIAIIYREAEARRMGEEPVFPVPKPLSGGSDDR
ncbi:MAG: hypothetical protein ACC661_12680 [Verrucomicrobiales bacterium]